MSKSECRELKNALASTRMEGYEVTKQTEQDCVRLMRGEYRSTTLCVKS